MFAPTDHLLEWISFIHAPSLVSTVRLARSIPLLDLECMGEPRIIRYSGHSTFISDMTSSMELSDNCIFDNPANPLNSLPLSVYNN